MTDARLALIRFVTGPHADLQGLRNAAFACSVIAMIGVIGWVLPAPKALAEMLDGTDEILRVTIRMT